MQINSNKHLLDIIRKHEVGIKYPDLIPCIAFNILIQKDNSIFDPYCYYAFIYWFHWKRTSEGHAYWAKIDSTLSSSNN